MKRFYVFEGRKLMGSTNTRKRAVELIRRFQSWKTASLKRAKYYIVIGEKEIIPYPDEEKGREDENNG